MRITACKTNHMVNPLGYGMERATISWITEDTASKRQTAAQVMVSMDEEGKEVLHDSGRREDIVSLAYDLPISLLPNTRYYWSVRVWGDAGDEAVSGMNWFETGKRTKEWQAKWITTPWEDENLHPCVRRSFHIPGGVKAARAYITGMGLYELELNGRRIGEERLTPYCNSYDAWVQYQTYDITEALREGSNTVGVMLNNGWAKGPFGTFGDLNTPYIDVFALLCELHITMEDGSTQVIASDSEWLCKPSPVVEDSIYNGEIYDANREIPGWSAPGLDISDWERMKEFTPTGLGKVTDRLSLPVLVKETIAPIRLLHTPAGELVLDMGQNMVGWLRIHIREPKGTRIKITHGEVLQEENFYRDNLRGAKAEYHFICDGSDRIIEPHTTFYGFRYAKLEGFTKPIRLEDFTGCVVYSDLEETGRIETSDPLVNRLFLNTLWSQKGNFLDVPTDCPQRDERMGWTGDAQVFAGTASFHMDTYAFYTKFMHDLYEDQKFSDGMVASTVPTFSKIKNKDSSFTGGGACAWSDCATVIPWEVYLHFGDKTILERQYQSMKDWVDWIRRQDEKSGGSRLWTVGFHFGDWLALDGPVEGGVMGGTDHGLLASAYYRLSTNILAKAAGVLGFLEDASFYGELSEEIKRAIWEEYFSKNGRSAVPTQTAHVVALHFELVETGVRQRILADLRALLRKNDMHLKTGFIGTPYLCRTLADNGAPEDAYRVFFQEDYPSWLYEVIMGATTVWERWNSVLPDGKMSGTGMNSLNHYAYGSIAEWMYRNMCGINPLEEAPGFRKFLLKPEVYGRLYYAKAELKSAMGLIESGWRREKNGTLTIEFTVPFHSEATAFLPDAKLDSVRGAEGLRAEQAGDRVKLLLGTGKYVFSYMPTKEYELKYSIAAPMGELLSNAQTREIMAELVPQFLRAIEENAGAGLPYSIEEAAAEGSDLGLRVLLRNADLKNLNDRLSHVPYPLRSC